MYVTFGYWKLLCICITIAQFRIARYVCRAITFVQLRIKRRNSYNIISVLIITTCLPALRAAVTYDSPLLRMIIHEDASILEKRNAGSRLLGLSDLSQLADRGRDCQPCSLPPYYSCCCNVGNTVFPVGMSLFERYLRHIFSNFRRDFHATMQKTYGTH